MVDMRIKTIKFIDGFVVYQNKLAFNMINITVIKHRKCQTINYFIAAELEV